MALAVLESDSIIHPPLECVFTTDEEVGMLGAAAMDMSSLKGKYMLNIDSEEEGIFLTSCAGGARVDCRLQPEFTEMNGVEYELLIGGLAGGHSGVEIHKERGNSNKLAGRLLWHLYLEEVQVGLISAQGGLADNAIPRETKVCILVEPEQQESFKAAVTAFEQEVKSELATKDPCFCITVKECSAVQKKVIADNALAVTSAFLNGLPNGVQAMSADIDGLVETSLNLGVLSINEAGVSASFSVRSSVESCKKALIEKLMSVVVLAGGEAEVEGDYPGWSYRVNSPLREKMLTLYKEMYGAEPKVEAIHAGLECGLLASKIEDLDCVSFGPNMFNIHTTEEKLSISSTKRVWDYLIALLERKG
jgi:dipeptidase D